MLSTYLVAILNEFYLVLCYTRMMQDIRVVKDHHQQSHRLICYLLEITKYLICLVYRLGTLIVA